MPAEIIPFEAKEAIQRRKLLDYVLHHHLVEVPEDDDPEDLRGGLISNEEDELGDEDHAEVVRIMSEELSCPDGSMWYQLVYRRVFVDRRAKIGFGVPDIPKAVANCKGNNIGVRRGPTGKGTRRVGIPLSPPNLNVPGRYAGSVIMLCIGVFRARKYNSKAKIGPRIATPSDPRDPVIKNRIRSQTFLVFDFHHGWILFPTCFLSKTTFTTGNPRRSAALEYGLDPSTSRIVASSSIMSGFMKRWNRIAPPSDGPVIADWDLAVENGTFTT
ncbi:hypothetical protein DFS33DRAFT_1273589 [Desarmillaria ectypa]|nr:hypothetical protein DFS33DRAFT_1273589 [Desarmillaria ectypa]